MGAAVRRRERRGRGCGHRGARPRYGLGRGMSPGPPRRATPEDAVVPLHLTYALVGTLAVVLALSSRRMRELPLSEPMLALVLGAVVGPYALGLITVPDDVRDAALLEGSRLIVALSVMEAALRFPASQLRRIVRAVALLLLVVMPISVVVSAAAALLVGLPLALAVLVGACLAPTDPVLAGSVV